MKHAVCCCLPRYNRNTPARPFLKWAGGKSQILPELRAGYPAALGDGIRKYAEPFVGGGAVLFDVLNRYELDEVYASDINRELIHTYQCIRDRADELIKLLGCLEAQYLRADPGTRKKLYYAKRELFNEFKLCGSTDTEIAALFIFLNRTCFNGLYRVNSKGEFNVPQGSYKNPAICIPDNLRAVSEKLQKVRIVCADYTQSSCFIDKYTFAYFDPPYRPLSVTASFTSYAQHGFDDDAQAKLARFIDRMSERGAYVVASNSDPKNSDESDNFFDALYAKHIVQRISASRAINSVGNNRGRVSELLIANYIP
jgi:DNA adenine methylase